MGPEREPSQESAWLLEPPGPGAINFRIRVGDEVELSPAAREAIETLLDELNGAEVSGYSPTQCGTFLKDCNPYTCSLTNCQPLVSKPCFVDMDCHVTEFHRGRF